MERETFGGDHRDQSTNDTYYKKLDVMSDVVVKLKTLIENGSIKSHEDATRVVLSEKIFEELGTEDLGILMNAIDEHFQTSGVIDRLVERLGDDPDVIFEYVFGHKPLGRVEVVRKNGFLGFILSSEDFAAAQGGGIAGSLIPENARVTGSYFPKSGSTDFPKECAGRVFIVAKNVEISTSPHKKTYLLREERDIQSTVNHEMQHALWLELISPLKEKVVNEKRVNEDTNIIVSRMLEDAMGQYFIGDNHVRKFISESGPTRFKATLKKFYSAQGNLEEKQGEIDAIIEEYRKKFFILYDALHATKGRVGSKKLEALGFLLPADRIERLVHFVGKDPEQWKKEWEQKNSDESLREREHYLTIKLGK